MPASITGIEAFHAVDRRLSLFRVEVTSRRLPRTVPITSAANNAISNVAPASFPVRPILMRASVIAEGNLQRLRIVAFGLHARSLPRATPRNLHQLCVRYEGRVVTVECIGHRRVLKNGELQ